MSDEHDPVSKRSETVSRRSVLQTTAGAATAAGAGLATAGGGAGLASATPGGDSNGDGPQKYNVGYSAESGRAAAREAATEVVREFAFDALTVRLPEQAVSGLRNRADVRYVEGNGASTLDAQRVPDGVDRMDAEKIWSHEDGTGIDVAILDTGIDGDHDDLVFNLGLGAWVNEGCDTCDYGWGDDEGHGTSVAGIVGADDNAIDVVGMAPDVTLHAVQVCDTEDSCEWGEIAAGLEWVADQGYEVANMSFSGDYSDLISDAVAYAADRDVLMVGSAGNDGPCTDCVNHPATEADVLGISSWARDGSLSDFSNQGPEIDFTAPGESLETTAMGGGTRLFSGTSASAPHVSGSAAIARALTTSRLEAERLLRDKAEDVGLTANEQGAGLPDVEAVVVEPWVEPGGVTLTETSATLFGDLHRFGVGASSGEGYFEWGLTGDGLPNTTAKQSLSSPGTFSETIGPLACETSYEYRAVVEADDGQVDRSATNFFFSHSCDDCADDRFCLKGEEDGSTEDS